MFAYSELCKFGGLKYIGRDISAMAASAYSETGEKMWMELRASGLLLRQAVNGAESPD